MRQPKRVFGLLGASALALFAASSPVQAQEPASETGASSESGDIIVTARRRSEALQDVPAQVTAFNAAADAALALGRPLDKINGTARVLIDWATDYGRE